MLDHHAGLTNHFIRDFLAESIETSGHNGVWGDEETLDGRVKQLEADVARAKEALKQFRTGRAVGILFAKMKEENGWDYFDISDHVKNDENYIGFIGNMEELQLMYPMAYEECVGNAQQDPT